MYIRVISMALLLSLATLPSLARPAALGRTVAAHSASASAFTSSVQPADPHPTATGVRKLNPPLVTGGEVYDLRISGDSSQVVYLASQDDRTKPELYRVPITGGMAVKLNRPLASGASVQQFDISPDDTRVVYRAQHATDQTLQLYSAPLAGGTPVNLGTADSFYFFVSPNSSRVAYINSDQLYSAPLAGGTPVNLGTVDYDYFLISPDSSRVVYPSGGQIYSVPLAGGTPVKLDSPAGASIWPYTFRISADSTHVIFRVGGNKPSELYSTPVAGGGPAIKLNGPLAANGAVTAFEISPNGSRVAYTANSGPFTQENLYSVPTTGGTAVKLNGPLDPDGLSVQYEFYISPDSSRVVYLADQQADDFSSLPQLYSAPLAGGSPAAKISGRLIRSGFISANDITFTPDSKYVLYRAEGTTEELYDLFSTPATCCWPAPKLNGSVPMVAGPPISSDLYYWFHISPDSRHVVFRGAQSREGPRELYATDIVTFNFTIFLPLVLH